MTNEFTCAGCGKTESTPVIHLEVPMGYGSQMQWVPHPAGWLTILWADSRLPCDTEDLVCSRDCAKRYLFKALRRADAPSQSTKAKP